MPAIFYDRFTLSVNLHTYETCWSLNDHLNIPTFRTQKYGSFSIRATNIYSWNSIEILIIKNLSLRISTSKKSKYFLIKHFIESTNRNLLGHVCQ